VDPFDHYICARSGQCASGLPDRFPRRTWFFGNDDSVLAAFKDIFLVWLGVSVATHAFPTFKDAEVIQKAFAAEHVSSFVQMIGGFLTAGAYIAAFGSIFWLDVICSVTLVVVMPILFIEILRSMY
jgi:hypothetical protein